MATTRKTAATSTPKAAPCDLENLLNDAKARKAKAEAEAKAEAAKLAKAEAEAAEAAAAEETKGVFAAIGDEALRAELEGGRREVAARMAAIRAAIEGRSLATAVTGAPVAPVDSTELTEALEKVETLEAEVTKAKADREELLRNAEALNNTLSTTEAERDKALEKVAQLEAEALEAAKAVRDMTSQIVTLEHRLDIAPDPAEFDRINSELEDKVLELGWLEARHAELMTKIDDIPVIDLTKFVPFTGKHEVRVPLSDARRINEGRENILAALEEMERGFSPAPSPTPAPAPTPDPATAPVPDDSSIIPGMS